MTMTVINNLIARILLLQPCGTSIQTSSFYVIYGRVEPRWVVPCDAAMGLPVLVQWRPYGFCSRLKWKLLLGLYRAGILNHASHITKIDIASASASAGSTDKILLYPVIYIGTPSPARKAVAILVNGLDGTIHSVIKVPLAEAASIGIEQEAIALRELEEMGLGQIPRIIRFDKASGATSQSAIDGTLSGRAFSRKHLDLLLKMPISVEATSLAQCGKALNNKLLTTSDCKKETSASLAGLIAQLIDERPINYVWNHGDFAPWNIKKCRDGTLSLIDWECAKKDGLPLHDFCHFFFIQAHLFGIKHPLKKMIASTYFGQYQASLKLDWAHMKQLIIHYVVSSVISSTANGNFEYSDFLISASSEVENL